MTRALLRIYADTASPDGFSLHAVPDNAWDENRITYRRMPDLGSVLADSGAHPTASYVTLDLTAHITGDGVYSLALTSLSAQAVGYPSREAAGNRPELSVEVGP